MQSIDILTDSDFVGERLDKYLQHIFPAFSRAALQKAIDAGSATVNGKSVSKNYKLRAGDKLVFTPLEARPLEVMPQNIPLEIVYEDGDLLVVNKPKGMVVHPAPGNPDGTLVNALLYHCGDSLSGINGVLRPGIVHRIDKDTRDRKKMAVTDKNSKPAITHYETLETYVGYAFVKLRLETGRTHQIRVHMAYLGHPLAGDTVYGHPKRKELSLGGQCLHAGKIGFVHPRTGEYLEFESPLPDYFTQFQRSLTLEDEHTIQN